MYVIDQFANELGYEFDRKGSLPPAMQLIIALHFYASASFQEVIGDTFGVSKGTVCRTIHRVSAVIAGTLDDHVKFDQQAEADRTKAKFFTIARFPGVIGCIDCMHALILKYC